MFMNLTGSLKLIKGEGQILIQGQDDSVISVSKSELVQMQNIAYVLVVSDADLEL